MRKSFTLIEVMIVVVILSVIAILVVPNLVGQSNKAKLKLTCVQMKTVSNNLDMFKQDNGVYPETEEGLMALINNPNNKYKKYTDGGYISGKKTPKDAWGNDFIYVNTEGKFNLYSFGSDGKEGGVKSDQDIILSDCEE